MSTLLIIGVLAVGGWCFFMGPCKEWISQITSAASGGGTGYPGLTPDLYGKIKSAVSSPEAQRIANQYSAGKISENQMREEALKIASKYANYSHSYLGRYHDVISV